MVNVIIGTAIPGVLSARIERDLRLAMVCGL
jgi:hypothetical protein